MPGFIKSIAMVIMVMVIVTQTKNKPHAKIIPHHTGRYYVQIDDLPLIEYNEMQDMVMKAQRTEYEKELTKFYNDRERN